jgi:hypothetical protein
VRAKRAGPGSHHALDQAPTPLLELAGSKQPEDDPFGVHDDARIPSGRLDALAHLVHRLVQPTRRHVTARHAAGARALGLSAFGGKPRREPVELSVDVVVDVGETETLEPPRGPRTEVSGRVPAVHDHGSTGV